jgi:hypothetical protein
MRPELPFDGEPYGHGEAPRRTAHYRRAGRDSESSEELDLSPHPQAIENSHSTCEDRQVPSLFRGRCEAIPESAAARLTVLMRVVHWSAQEN